MNINTMTFVSAIALALVRPACADDPSQEEDPHSYASLAGGAVWLSDMEFEIEVPAIAERGALNTDTGWTIVGALGYSFGGGLRTELEVGYRSNEGELSASFEDGLLLSDSSVSALDVMANVLWDFGSDMPVQPYVGLGIGAVGADVEFENGKEADGWAFAYQVIAGMTCPLPHMAAALFVDYRYLATEGLELDAENIYSGSDEYRSHAVLGGIRVTF